MREMHPSCLLFKQLPQPQIAVTNDCVLIPAHPSAHCCRHYFRRRASLAVHHTSACHKYITYFVCWNISKSKEKRRRVLKETGWLKGWVELPHFIFMLLVQDFCEMRSWLSWSVSQQSRGHFSRPAVVTGTIKVRLLGIWAYMTLLATRTQKDSSNLPNSTWCEVTFHQHRMWFTCPLNGHPPSPRLAGCYPCL